MSIITSPPYPVPRSDSTNTRTSATPNPIPAPSTSRRASADDVAKVVDNEPPRTSGGRAARLAAPLSPLAADCESRGDMGGRGLFFRRRVFFEEQPHAKEKSPASSATTPDPRVGKGAQRRAHAVEPVACSHVGTRSCHRAAPR